MNLDETESVDNRLVRISFHRTVDSHNFHIKTSRQPSSSLLLIFSTKPPKQTIFIMISSIAARRSTLLMATRHLPKLSTPAATVTSAPLSTVASQQVLRMEDLLTSMHWIHLKDNVEEVRQLLNEPKTNHSLHPESSLEDDVTRELRMIEDMVVKGSSSDLPSIESRVCGLKNHVRSQLYHLG